MKGKPSHFTINIRQSKTDIWRHGHKMKVYALGTKDCPVKLMADYLEVRPASKDSKPFFLLKNGSFLTSGRLIFSTALKKGIGSIKGCNPKHFTTHSCRQGGAVSLAAMGVSDAVIHAYGRWKSMSMHQYISEFTPETIQALQKKMANLKGDAINQSHLGVQNDRFSTDIQL